MRLNTDNPDTMPVTDSVYGKKKAGPIREAVAHSGRQLWQAVSDVDMAALRNLGGRETKRFFHIRTRGTR